MDVWVGEHRISSTKLLKLAHLYPVYCTVVLIAFIIFKNLLIKKVFPMIILNNNKYSGHCTLSCIFFFSKHFRNVIYFSHHLCFLLVWGNSEGATVIVWGSVVKNIIVVALQLVCCDPHLHITSLDGQFNILILLNMHSMQWRILIPRSSVSEGYTVWHYIILLDPTSKSGVATASVNLKSSVRHVCLRWDIKMDGVTICNMWYCCLNVLLSKGEYCNNDLVYFHCCL